MGQTSLREDLRVDIILWGIETGGFSKGVLDVRQKEKTLEKCISSEITFTLTGVCPVIQLWAVGLDRTLTRVKKPFPEEITLRHTYLKIH